MDARLDALEKDVIQLKNLRSITDNKLDKSVDQVKKDIISELSKVVHNDSFSSVLDDFKKVIKDHEKNIERLAIDMKNAQSRLRILDQIQLSDKVNSDNHSQLISHNSQHINENREFVVSRLSSVESNLKVLCHSFRDEMSKRIDEIKTIAVNGPNEVQKIKDEITDKVNSAILDGNNAFLKSNNSESKIKLLERKIENLALLLKKFELTR